MNRMDFLLCRGSLTLLLAVGLTASRTPAQQSQETLSHPPKSFSSEDDKFPHAVPLPDCVRRVLASDEHVVNTLNYEELSPEQLPTDWFTASKTYLGPHNASYFVVMGAGVMRGANINPFWVFRRSARSCNLLLSVGAHDLQILKTRTNGLRDIEISALTAVRYFQTRFKFDGHSYQVVKRTSQPIGDEIPRDLSNFETRKPLVQGVGQNPEPILVEARAWLWRQWWLEKLSYLKVTLHSKEGDETTTTYYIRKTGQALEVVIQTHRILIDRALHTGGRRPIVEDMMVVAADVERRLALKNNPDRKMEIPEGQEALPDSYELYFNDESGDNLAVL
jgi:hypothetical protein